MVMVLVYVAFDDGVVITLLEDVLEKEAREFPEKYRFAKYLEYDAVPKTPASQEGTQKYLWEYVRRHGFTCRAFIPCR